MVKYQQLSANITTGWNTWDNRSILSHVLLPAGLAFQMIIEDTLNNRQLPIAFPGNHVADTEKVRTLAHTPDGSYTDVYLQWQDFGMQVQSVTFGADELLIKITPDRDFGNPGFIRVDGKMLYGGTGEIEESGAKITATLPNRTIILKKLQSDDAKGKFRCGLQKPIFLSTDNISNDQAETMIAKAEQSYLTEKDTYGKMSEVYDAIQNAVNWTVVYDPVKDRAVTPVARTWSYGWGKGQPGGFILFCWDNFFAAYMHALNSKELAFNEAIQMCNEIDELGFVPNFSGPFDLKSRDRSQPPVGSMMVLGIYNLHPEKWFLEKVFNQLLTWNRWWSENRDYEGYLCWGSNPYTPASDDKRLTTQHNFKAASNESGLDNTPMYDGVKFNKETNMLEMADVGLMGLYIADCKALAKIADILGERSANKELLARAKKYDQKLQSMWDEEFGMFLNVHTDSGKKSRRISPTNFYALISATATQQQAKRMIAEHFYNPEEFWGDWIMPSIARNDTAYTGKDYWRGSIWAPMNFLVYLGMQNYDIPKARRDLADKSYYLLMKEWRSKGYIRENYHAETGGDPNYRSEHFYHWGALLGMINMIEYEKTKSPMGLF